ncbi:ribokinase, partial [Streptomonospora salina]|uniref:ribokinase n=1 Tax=Streptomonospora salina TaxID=104205 RepID=UPI0035EB216D
GAAAAFLGAVGEDAFGTQLRTNLVGCGVGVAGLHTRGAASGTAHIVVESDGANSIIVVPGANAEVTGLRTGDRELIAGSAALLLQLELPMDAVVAAARAGRAAGVPTVLTPAPARELPAELLEQVDLLVPNQHEAAKITGETDPRAALAALLRTVPEAIVTLGGDGSLYGARGGDPVHVPARAATPVDTTAAGDTFCGAFAVARAEERSPEECLRFAAEAAAVSVGRHGAAPSMPERAEIEELLARG